MTMTDRPVVSVIVPAYNAERFVGRTLENLLAQTYRDIEVIVVDDGSTDGTVAAIEAVRARDGRVRLLRQANGGVSKARNTAIAVARGAFVAPLDADDLWHPTKLEKQLACFDGSSPDTGVVYCYFAVIDEQDRLILPRRIYHAPTGQVYPQLAVGNIVGNASAPLIRRSVLAAVGDYDESFKEGCEDLDVYLRLAERCAFGLVPEFLVGYRRSRESMSMNIPKMERAVAQLTRKMLARHPTLPRRLLRWRNGNMYRYLALHALMASNRRRAFVLAAKSALSDPLLLGGWVVTRLGSGRRKDATIAGPGPDYLAVSPVPTRAEAFRATAIDARRHRAAARMRIDGQPA